MQKMIWWPVLVVVLAAFAGGYVSGYTRGFRAGGDMFRTRRIDLTGGTVTLDTFQTFETAPSCGLQADPDGVVRVNGDAVGYDLQNPAAKERYQANTH